MQCVEDSFFNWHKNLKCVKKKKEKLLSTWYKEKKERYKKKADKESTWSNHILYAIFIIQYVM